MVSFYWTFLYQFGDIIPTIYKQNVNANPYDGPIFINGMGSPNFSAPITFTTANNIFRNQTLFGIYSQYLLQTLVPAIPKVFPRVTFNAPQLEPLSSTNQIQRSPTSILTSYQCSQLVWKGWVNALISILVAVSSLWTGGYTFALMLLKLRHEE